jgi:hypothetical protein
MNSRAENTPGTFVKYPTVQLRQELGLLYDSRDRCSLL